MRVKGAIASVVCVCECVCPRVNRRYHTLQKETNSYPNPYQVARLATPWLNDVDAYCIATHNYKEVEAIHTPCRGHSKTLDHSGRANCMPCCCRIVRSGGRDWGAGLQGTAHVGSIDALCFYLNRLCDKKEGALPYMLERDKYGCNAIMHAANDNVSGLSATSIRLLAHAASLQGGTKSARRLVNSTDTNGYSPAAACITTHNETGLRALLGLRGRLWPSVKKSKHEYRMKMPKDLKKTLKMTLKFKKSDPTCTPKFRMLINAIVANSNDKASCSHCGKTAVGKRKLLACGICRRARYCNKKCQNANFPNHKFICKPNVERDPEWYARNVSRMVQI